MCNLWALNLKIWLAIQRDCIYIFSYYNGQIISCFRSLRPWFLYLKLNSYRQFSSLTQLHEQHAHDRTDSTRTQLHPAGCRGKKEPGGGQTWCQWFRMLCPADSLTSAAVVSSYVKEDEELLSHLETLEDIKEELCCPAEASGPNGDANHLTR